MSGDATNARLISDPGLQSWLMPVFTASASRSTPFLVQALALAADVLGTGFPLTSLGARGHSDWA